MNRMNDRSDRGTTRGEENGKRRELESLPIISGLFPLVSGLTHRSSRRLALLTSSISAGARGVSERRETTRRAAE